MLQRNVEPRIVRKRDDEHFLNRPIRPRDLLQALIAPDPVFEMHHEIVFVQLAEIDLRPPLHFARAAHRHPSRARVAVTPEQLRIAENRDLRAGKDEAVRQRADDEFQRIAFHSRDDLAQALDFSLVVAENMHAPTIQPPSAQALEELLALDLIHHEIPRLELAESVIEKRRRIILDRIDALRGFKNPHARLQKIRARVYRHSVLAQVIPQRTRPVLRLPEQQRASLDLLHARLRIEIEMPQRFDLVVEQLHTNRKRVMERIDVQDSPAHRKLPARRNLRDMLVSRLRKLPDELLTIQPRRAFQHDREMLQRIRRRHLPVQTRPRQHHDLASLFRPELLHDPEPLRRSLRVRQCTFHRRHIRFRKKERIGKPVEQLIVKGLLRAHIPAHDPHAGLRLPRHDRRKKRLRRLDHMLKDHVAAGTQAPKLRSDRPGAGDVIENVCLHRRAHPFAQSTAPRKRHHVAGTLLRQVAFASA